MREITPALLDAIDVRNRIFTGEASADELDAGLAIAALGEALYHAEQPVSTLGDPARARAILIQTAGMLLATAENIDVATQHPMKHAA